MQPNDLKESMEHSGIMYDINMLFMIIDFPIQIFREHRVWVDLVSKHLRHLFECFTCVHQLAVHRLRNILIF